MRHHEILQQVIWGNKLFTIREKPLFFKSWIESGLIYVKDLIIQNDFLNVNYIYQKLQNKTNWISEYYQIKSTLNSIMEKIDIEQSKYINIPSKSCKSHIYCILKYVLIFTFCIF